MTFSGQFMVCRWCT